MNANIAKAFRTVQVLFPFIQDYRFQAQRKLRTLLNRPHEDDFDALTLLPRTSNNLFLDIGANRGDAIHSILMRRPDAHVIGFEPNVILMDKMRKIYADDSRVEIRNVGLADNDGSFDLYVPFYNNYMFDGLASFIERRAHRALTKRLYGFDPEKLEVKKLRCEVKRLDDMNLQPYFIKIDVQGFEYQVLRGAQRTLAACKPIMLIETPGQEECDFLNWYGYKPFVFRKRRMISGTDGLNVFFIHNEMR